MKVAIVGASENRDKFGNKAVRAYLSKGHTVYPVHPKASEIEGQKCVRSVKDVSELDRICLYVPESTALSILPEFAQHKAAEIWLNPGADDPAVVKECDRLGLNSIQACAIVDIGLSPSQFP